MCFPLQKKSCPARYIYQKGHSTSSRVGTKKWLSNKHGWLYHGAKKPMSCFHNFCQLQLLKPGRFATDFYSKPWFRQTNWNSLPFQENEWMCPRMLPSHVLLVRGEIPVFWGTWCTWMVMMLLEKLKMQYQELLVLFVCTLAIPWVALNNKKNIVTAWWVSRKNYSVLFSNPSKLTNLFPIAHISACIFGNHFPTSETNIAWTSSPNLLVQTHYVVLDLLTCKLFASISVLGFKIVLRMACDATCRINRHTAYYLWYMYHALYYICEYIWYTRLSAHVHINVWAKLSNNREHNLMSLCSVLDFQSYESIHYHLFMQPIFSGV